MIMSEISRITDHLTCVGASAMELGAFTVFLHDQGARIPVGAGRDGDRRAPDRFLLSGGWSEGRSARWFSRAVRKALQETRKVLAESDGLLTRNRIFVVA